jgi:hypothetical protein
MKLLYFNDYRLGVLKGDRVVDVTQVVQNVPHTGPGNLINGVIERWADLRGPIDKVAGSGNGLPVAQVKMRSPLPKPVNIDCMAVNYMEDGTRKEPAPINAFLKSPGCLAATAERSCPTLPSRPSRRGRARGGDRQAREARPHRAMEHVLAIRASSTARRATPRR